MTLAPAPPPGLQGEIREAVKDVQQVTVVEHWHPFGNCPQCVAGYSR